MLILEGKLRRVTELEIKGEKRSKLTVEYEVPRYEGDADLKLQDFFLEPQDAKGLQAGGLVTLLVRAYVSGKDVALTAVGVRTSQGGKAA